MSAPKQYPRAERVRHQIQQVLAAEIERLRDPGMGFVTITEVTLTPDMRNARAYFTVLGSETERLASTDALVRATKHLRGIVAKHVRLRYVPALEFLPDPVPERAKGVDELLAKLRADDAAPTGDDTDDDDTVDDEA